MTRTALEAKDHPAKKRSINHLPNSNHHILGLHIHIPRRNGNEMSWCCENTSLVVFSQLIIWGTWFHFHAHLHHLLHLLWRHVFHHVAHGIHPRRWWELVEDWPTVVWVGLGGIVFKINIFGCLYHSEYRPIKSLYFFSILFNWIISKRHLFECPPSC